MPQRLTDSRIANLGAQAICVAFHEYQSQFEAITQRARQRFEQRDWPGMHEDMTERLDLYKHVVDRVVATIDRLLDDRSSDKLVWASMKAVYSGLIADSDEWELAETFFNSVTRRIFATVGVDNQIEFVDTDFETPPTQSSIPVYRTYDQACSAAALFETLLTDYQFQAPFEDLYRDAHLVADEIDEQLRRLGRWQGITRVELAKSVFYRGQGAYLVGRMFSGAQLVPLVLALLNTPNGIVVDAVLLSENDVSILFSFTRSYFHVEMDRSYDLVRFLKSIMPRKRIAELYIAIGYNKHGKTELYRDMLAYLAHSEDQFEVARGERGMVMMVFTMPGYDLVFKIIKDHFAHPKDTSRQAVMKQYQLVFRHDRAGRLIDAQEFEHLRFDRHRFSQELLAELQRDAAQTVVVEGDRVIVKHAYIERRVTPLNLYVREADLESARAIVIDYGNTIKDLAATNIFPGDILLKNFGVTRHGRVVFYDYDELCLLTGCRFRAMPQPSSHEEEIAAEPWFSVHEDDVFPEEFKRFLGLPQPLHDLFMQHHADLFEVHFWRSMQERLRNGEIIHTLPYTQDRRLLQRRVH